MDEERSNARQSPLPVPPGVSEPSPLPPPVQQPQLPSRISIAGRAILGFFFIGLLAFGAWYFFLRDAAKQKQQTVMLTYWGLQDDGATVRSAVSDFEKQHAVRVSYVKQDAKQYQERLLTRVQNGTGPDVFEFHNTWLLVLLPLLSVLPTDVIRPEDFEQSFYPLVRGDLTRSGAIYGVPLSIDTLSLFVNKEILDAGNVSVPTTWNEFVDAARTLTVKDETGRIQTAGAAIGTFDNVTHAPDILSLLFAQNGVNFRDIAVSRVNASDALTFYTQFALPSANVWDETFQPSIEAFAKGNLALYFGYARDMPRIETLNPTLPFAVHVVPRLPGRNMTIGSYWAAGVSTRSKQQKEAMLLLSFLAQKEASSKRFTQREKANPPGIPPARVDFAEMLRMDHVLFPFVQQGSDAVSSYFASDTNDSSINAPLNGYLGNAVRAILSGNTAESTIDTLDQGVKQVLKQYVTQ